MKLPSAQIILSGLLSSSFLGGCVTSEQLPVSGPTLLRDKIYTWGYVLDKVPTACPFVFGKTRCSLETETQYLGARKAIYMNSMFNRDYILKHFPKWDRECFENCIDNKLSAGHLERLASIPEVYCTLEHNNRIESAQKIAYLSLQYPNIKGINLDDFNNGNKATAMSPQELKELREMILRINPELKITVVSYAHPPYEHDMTPYAEYVDIFSRWCWNASHDYWDYYHKDMQKLRRQIGPGKKIVQGIYLHDFGAGMESLRPVPLDIFQKSIRVTFESILDGTIDGVIIPQAGWFSFPSHQEHIVWLKNYLDWIEATASANVFSLPPKKSSSVN